MTDCPNAEMRDRLPDLLHERLETSLRAAVMAHVEECDDCRAEITLLREARIVLSPEMRAVDVVAISRVVIEQTRQAARTSAKRSPWTDWRIAASVALLVVGAGSIALVRRSSGTRPLAAVVADTHAVMPNAAVPDTAAAAPSSRPDTPVEMATTAELSAAAPVSDLSEGELRALLRDLDQIDAVPSPEPEQANVRVSLPGGGSSE
ncbi:MAG TPA: zf-HC2 domain-containing protein [Gemmatimonadaceae bacterium]|nr:zf-HC2 domain-containing protein [Gemmatimonadaceae bacterium]